MSSTRLVACSSVWMACARPTSSGAFLRLKFGADFSGKHECRLSDVKGSMLGHGLDRSFLFGPVKHTTI